LAFEVAHTAASERINFDHTACYRDNVHENSKAGRQWRLAVPTLVRRLWTRRPGDLQSSEFCSGAASGTCGRSAGRVELRLHRAPECVTLQLLPGDRFMRQSQLTQSEFVSE
jgi:hypothetical protein